MKENIKLSLFAGDAIPYIGNLKESLKKKLELTINCSGGPQNKITV